MIGAGHDRLAAMGLHGGRDLRRVGGDRDPADVGGLARRSTWTIIGRPAISSSGLPGSRVAAMRAGISTKVRVSVIGMRGPGPC